MSKLLGLMHSRVKTGLPESLEKEEPRLKEQKCDLWCEGKQVRGRGPASE